MLVLRDAAPTTDTLQLSTGDVVLGNVLVYGFFAAGAYAVYKFFTHYKKHGLRGASRRRRSKRRGR